MVIGITAVSLPTFLVGTLAVQLQASMHFGAEQLGLVVGCSSATAAVLGVPNGILAERLGGARVLRGAVLSSCLALTLIALLAGSWEELALLMVLAGACSSLAQVGSNLYLARRMDPHQQGLAFGLKQSAVPLATLLGGLAVPSLALTVGWRWGFGAAAVLALVATLLLPRPQRSVAQRRAAAARRAEPEPLGPLVALAIAFGLSLTAAGSLGTFLVTSAVAGGMSAGAAGILAAVASVGAVASRVGVGALADRRQGGHLAVVALMITGGGVGFGLLALGTALHQPLALAPGAVIAFGVGWGWNGLFNFAVVTSHRGAPARATGVTQTGGRLGSVAGPLLFGILAAHFGFGWAWTAATAEAALGAGLMLWSGRLLRRSQARLALSPR